MSTLLLDDSCKVRVRRTIRKVRGCWTLTVGKGTRKSRNSSSYVFNPESLVLGDDNGVELTKLVLRPIAESPLERPDGFVNLPIVRIVSSEVMREIQNPKNDGALFVLPSQMNGAEYPHHTAVVAKVSDYRWDRTAGPRGQLAVDPAVSQFLLDNASSTANPGGIDVIAELLAQLRSEGHKGFELRNGYLSVPRLSEEAAAAACAAFERSLYRLLTLASVGVRACGLAPDLERWSGASHKVSLVYASAVPVASYNNPAKTGSVRAQVQQDISALALRGAYLGALRVALEAKLGPGRTRVFAMPLGGGVFNNAPGAIARSFSEALELAEGFCPDLNDRLDVRFLTWDGKPEEAQEFSKLLKNHGKLMEDMPRRKR